MKTVGAYEAKTHLSRLLDDVARGETVTITKHGVPVALLTRPGVVGVDVGAEIDKWLAYRATIPVRAGPSLREMLEEGRKY